MNGKKDLKPDTFMCMHSKSQKTKPIILQNKPAH